MGNNELQGEHPVEKTEAPIKEQLKADASEIADKNATSGRTLLSGVLGNLKKAASAIKTETGRSSLDVSKDETENNKHELEGIKERLGRIKIPTRDNELAFRKNELFRKIQDALESSTPVGPGIVEYAQAEFSRIVAQVNNSRNEKAAAKTDILEYSRNELARNGVNESALVVALQYAFPNNQGALNELVHEFQVKNKLPADGKITPKTIGKLLEQFPHLKRRKE